MSSTTRKLERPKKPEYKPGKTPESILEKQRENLAKTIKALSHAEEKRASRLDRTDSRLAREALEARFDKEREHDQKRIMIIKDDYESLKKSVETGSFTPGKIQDRYRQQMGDRLLPKKLQSTHNRFQGLETPTDVILFKANVHMFEKYDEKYRQRADMTRYMQREEETFKLGLLKEKRDVLKQLIHVQQRDMQAPASTRVNSARSVSSNKSSSAHFMLSSRTNNGGGGRGRPSSSASTASSASAASWASFAPSTNNRFGAAKNSSFKPSVPALKFKK